MEEATRGLAGVLYVAYIAVRNTVYWLSADDFQDYHAERPDVGAAGHLTLEELLCGFLYSSREISDCVCIHQYLRRQIF